MISTKPLSNSKTTTRVDVHSHGKTPKVSTKGARMNNGEENVDDQKESSRIKETDDPSENDNFVKRNADTAVKNPAISDKVENQDGPSNLKDGDNSSKRTENEGTPPISKHNKENKSMSEHCENGPDKSHTQVEGTIIFSYHV